MNSLLFFGFSVNAIGIVEWFFEVNAHQISEVIHRLSKNVRYNFALMIRTMSHALKTTII